MRTYIQQPGQVGIPGAPGNVGYLAQMPPAINSAEHERKRKGALIYNKGQGVTGPERKVFLDPKRVGPMLPPMARLDGQMNINMPQTNDAYLQEQERQRLLQEQQAQAELNNSMYGGGQYNQADQYNQVDPYSAVFAGFHNKYVS